MLAARAKTTRVLTVVGVLVCGTLRADPIEDLSRQAADAYKARDFATAVARYRELVRLGPTRPELHLWLGRALLKSGEPGAARRACEAGQKVQAGADQKAIDGLAACIATAQAELTKAPPPVEPAVSVAKAERRKGEKAKKAPPPKEEPRGPVVAAPTGPAPASAAAGAGCGGERPGMACIPGGWFTMGSNDGDEDEKPPLRREVKTFYMDKTEVKVEDYRACVQAGKCKDQRTTNYGTVAGKDEAFWSQLCNLGKAGRDEHPMNCVDWEQARAYCAYVKKRLPTEKEWEYAARGSAGRKYPWGNEPAPGPTLLNACGDECVAWFKEKGLTSSQMYKGNDGWANTAPVGQYPAGRTPEGLLDMAGNVWEWVQDAYSSCYDASRCEPEQARRVLRGASWDVVDPRNARAAGRSGSAAGFRHVNVGFRCAQD